jgi:tripartite-type tricarboxylate transporter receptor subunit TctC
MLRRISLAAIGLWLAATGAALAQAYPSKSVTMIIPFAAGGPTDVLGRVMAQRMSELLGQQVVVENVGGAGGMTGSKRVADAAPDGYTFVLGTVGRVRHCTRNHFTTRRPISRRLRSSPRSRSCSSRARICR